MLVGKPLVGNELLCFNDNPMFSLHLWCYSRVLFHWIWEASWGWQRKCHCLHFWHVLCVNYLWYFIANGVFCSIFVNNEFFMTGHLCLWILCHGTSFLNTLCDKISIPFPRLSCNKVSLYSCYMLSILTPKWYMDGYICRSLYCLLWIDIMLSSL